MSAPDWLKVAVATSEAQALIMEEILKDAGIPVVIEQSSVDISGAAPGESRDVLVPESALEEARKLLEKSTGLGGWTP